MYSPYNDALSLLASSAVIIALNIVFGVLALAGAIVLMFTVFSKKKEGSYTGFMGWLYDFVHFKVLTLDTILKICYLSTAIYLTLSSFLQFANGGTGLVIFLVQISLGNVAARIVYELFQLLIIIARNTNEITKKMGGKDSGFREEMPRFEKKPAPVQPVQYQQTPVQPVAPVQQAFVQPVAPVQQAPVIPVPVVEAPIAEVPAAPVVAVPVAEAPAAPVQTEAPKGSFCPNCGTHNQTGAVFCKQCGTKIG